MLPTQLLFVFQLGSQRIHWVRSRGGNTKYRALRLDTGNFSWGSECECNFYLFLIIINQASFLLTGYNITYVSSLFLN